MKVIEQYFHVVLFVKLHKMVLTFWSVDETLVLATHMKANEEYFHWVLIILL